ncbi:MAG: hypothetical protein JWM11_2936 [Planctomycetaceae bacterium]|nr:hypothetical protein [Planctomycetaceae bacterium]
MTTNTTHAPIPFADHGEIIPVDEIDDIRQVLIAVETLLRRKYEKTGLRQSDVHVKAVGCAKGEFRVLPNLPEELTQGLFSRDRTYSALVRFSNSASQVQPDWIPDGRGLALKVFDVEGEMLPSDKPEVRAQDFIMLNHPVFFARNVKEFLRVEQVLVAADENPLAVAKGALTGGDWNPLNWHWREAVTAVQIAGHLPVHPASNTYYSAAPIRFGKYVAKYRIRPASVPPETFLEVVNRLRLEANALSLMLEETLKSQQLLFEFQVQLRTSTETMPIEDASAEWPESESPFRTVAVLLLPRQEIGGPMEKQACKQLSFNVWNALAEHQPLGGINRLRKDAYRVSSAWRHLSASGN